MEACVHTLEEEAKTTWGSQGILPRGCSTRGGVERWEDFFLTEKDIPARENGLCKGTEDCLKLVRGGLSWMAGSVQ